MGSGFPDDKDNRSKLDVAKDCLLHITRQLGPRDRLSVITFNTETKVVLATDYCTPRHINKQVPPHLCRCCLFAPHLPVLSNTLIRLSKVLAGVQINGGTNLARGIQAGFDELRSLEQTSLLSRAIFLTDMESGPADEQRVIQGVSAISGRILLIELYNSIQSHVNVQLQRIKPGASTTLNRTLSVCSNLLNFPPEAAKRPLPPAASASRKHPAAPPLIKSGPK